MATVSQEDFAAPGPGVWVSDPQHFPRPMCRLFTEWQWPAAARGAAEGQRRYGTFAAPPSAAFPLRFSYRQPQQVIARPSGDEDEARALFTRLVEASPEAQAHLEAARRVFETRLWREDMRRWDAEEKPRAVARTRALAAVEVDALDAQALAAHIAECMDHLAEANTRHHTFTPTWAVPLGEFLLHAREWTGLDATRLLALMEGASPISAGRSGEFDALRAALQSDQAAHEGLVSATDAGAAVAALRARPGATGDSARAFFEVHGYVSTGGFDPVDTYALERPDVLLGRVRLALTERIDDRERDARVQSAIAEVRAAVPATHREAFDDLLAEARYCYRVKDERGMYNDMSARGLTRRALLEAGQRLQRTGRIGDAEHLLEAGPEELRALLAGGATPAAEELAARYDFRIVNSDVRAPLTLGTTDGVPPSVPLEWLPAPIQRVARALSAMTEASRGDMGTQEDGAATRALRGVPASRGIYEGRARVVLGPDDLQRLERGDVLVISATTPAISAWLPLIGAIVTDRGGPLSHAAIVAREYGIPAVVGTSTATTTFKTGARLRVDALTGTVEQLGEE